MKCCYHFATAVYVVGVNVCVRGWVVVLVCVWGCVCVCVGIEQYVYVTFHQWSLINIMFVMLYVPSIPHQ